MVITSRKVTRYRAVENCEDLSGEDENDSTDLLNSILLGEQCLSYSEEGSPTCLRTKQVCQKREYQNGYCK